MTAAESSFLVLSFIVVSRTVASILYLVFGVGTVVPGVLGRNIALADSIWTTILWFLGVLDWRHSVWVVVMDVGMLGLIYRGVGAITVKPGVLGRNISLTVSIWRTGIFYLVTVAWSHSVWVVVMDVVIFGLVYCGVRARTVAYMVSGRDIALSAST